MNVDPKTWQPSWCDSKDTCGPKAVFPSEPMHYSDPIAHTKTDGEFGTAEDGESFTASVRRMMFISSLDGGPDEASIGLGLRLEPADESELGVYMSTHRARELAAWLMEQANALDEWTAREVPSE